MDCYIGTLVILKFHILVLVLNIHKDYFHRHGILPLHGKTHFAIDDQTETRSKRLNIQLTQM
jgi:hypothetical protein